MFRLTMRLHLLLKAKPDLMEKKFTAFDGRLISFAEVADDVDPEFMDHHWKLVSVLVANLILTLPGSYSQADVPYFSSLMAKIRKCMSATCLLTGMAVYVPLSVMKLSYKPNMIYETSESGHQLQLRAFRDIAANEDVNFCFCEAIILMPKSNRSDCIRFFKLTTCHCDRCHASDQGHEADELLAGMLIRQEAVLLLDDVREPPNSVIGHVLRHVSIVKKYAGEKHPLTIYTMSVAVRLIRRLSAGNWRNYRQEMNRLVSEIEAANQ